MFSRRLTLIRHTLRYGIRGTLPQWAFNVLGPTHRYLAGRQITTAEQCDGFTRFKLCGYPGWLYVPSPTTSAGLDINQVLCEALYPLHWHNYGRARLDDVILDCGAAEGLFAFTQRHARAIHLFEPLPEYHRALQMTFDGLQNVTIHPVGLGDTFATAYLLRDGGSSRIVDHETDTQVPIVTIDSVCAGQISPTLIKMDVEGYELPVLRGAAETIRRFKPRLAVTVYHRDNDYKVITRFLRLLVPDYEIRVQGIEWRFGGKPILLMAERR